MESKERKKGKPRVKKERGGRKRRENRKERKDCTVSRGDSLESRYQRFCDASMDNVGDNIQELIKEIEELQLQESELMIRLRRATNNLSRANVARATRLNPTRFDSGPAPRGFAVGDKVQIKNPSPFQANPGVISKIGGSCIHVQMQSGSNILLAPKNLAIDNE